MIDENDRAQRLLQGYSGAIFDVLRAMGMPSQALPHSIRPLDDSLKVAGPVFTVEGRRVDGLDAHESLLQWTSMLSRAPAGSVVVCQPHDSELAHMGELSAETFHKKGILGYVVDGGCRDTDFITRLGFPVFCRYNTPVDVVGRWRAESFGEPIRIGDVEICTGDWIFSDRDGSVVIPADHIDAVIEDVERVLRTENKVRTAIMNGTDPKEAYLTYGKF